MSAGSAADDGAAAAGGGPATGNDAGRAGGSGNTGAQVGEAGFDMGGAGTAGASGSAGTAAVAGVSGSAGASGSASMVGSYAGAGGSGAPPTCGDGQTQSGEECDDGNTTTEACAAGQSGCTVCNATCHSVAGAVSGSAAQPFSMPGAYNATSGGSGTTCVSTSLKSINGHEPTAAGTYPVAVYMTGTYMTYNGADAQAFTQRMAARGFVAATVEYINSSYPSTCAVLEAKASCIFNAASANSAISKLCARTKADCSKGIVVSGFSQGANLATLAKDNDSRARAALVFGDVYKPVIYNLMACLQDSATVFTASQMRAISGEVDGFAGGNSSNVRADLISVTGRSCAASVWDCLQPDGSGWYMVKNAEVVDGNADHCFLLDGGCGTSSLDLSFSTGSAAWSLDTGLAWLAGRVALGN